MLRTLRKLLRPGFPVPGRVVRRTPSVVILASGVEQRWTGIQHKQLAAIDGQPLVLRTLGQLAQRWDTRPVVVTHHKLIAKAVAKVADVLTLEASQRRWTVETALASRTEWGDPTLVLAGDVYWTEEALDIACGFNLGGPIRYLITANEVGEDILGLWFRRRHRHRVARALNHAIEHARLRGGGGKLWQSYRSLCGFPLVRHLLENTHAVRIGDESTDFDTLLDYQEFLERRKARAA
jgi:molybdopterin-guanine dinucleotide biosynthesis protein A